MDSSNFRANVLLRTFAFAALSFVLAWSLVNTHWLATPFVCVGLLLLIAFELIHYVERSSRDLASFLSFVANHDFSTPLSMPWKGRAFTELQDAYQLLAAEFRRLNLQKAANHQYL